MPGPNDSPQRPRPAGPDDVDETSQESFPASDAPSWTPLHVGEPDAPPEERRPDAGGPDRQPAPPSAPDGPGEPRVP